MNDMKIKRLEKKGRKDSLHFLFTSRILPAIALLYYIFPAFLMMTACVKVIDPADKAGVNPRGQSVLNINLMHSGSLKSVTSGTLDIFVFNDDRLKRLDSYQRFTGENINGVTAASRKGRKIVAAVINSGKEKSDWAGINSLDALLKTVVELGDEDPAYPVMCGMTEVNMGEENECVLAVSPMISEIYIRSIRCDFSGTSYPNEKLKLVRIYLTNVNGRARLFDKSGFMPEQIINGGRLSEADMSAMLHPEMLLKETDMNIGYGTAYPEIRLCCFPNDCREESPGSPFTRLVIEGKVRGMTYYYPIEINREEISASGDAGIGRNRRYVYDITLTRVGTISPEMLAKPTSVSLQCAILPWEELPEQEVGF